MSTLRTDTIANAAGTVSVPTNTVVNGSAKAWVNFNGTGTVAIRASFNVSSISDNGTGDYTVNFTAAMADANYAFSVNGRRNGSADNNFTATVFPVATANTNYPMTATTCQIRCGVTSSSTALDSDVVSLIVFD